MRIYRTNFKYNKRYLALFIASFFTLIPASFASPDCIRPIGITSNQLQECITIDGLSSHLKMFQRFADNNKELPGTRFTGTEGYDTSRDYIVKKMTEAGYKVTLQNVPIKISYFPKAQLFEQKTPAAKTYTDGIDFTPYVNSGSADVTASVDIPSGDIFGCTLQDFNGFAPGNIALVERGGACSVREKTLNAITAGAKAVIVYEDIPGILFIALDNSNLIETTPVVSATTLVGNELKQQAQTGDLPQVHIQFNAVTKQVNSQNIIAESQAGNPNKVVLVGAHLDSSAGNSGMNDNASAVATILETALLMQKTNPVNKLRFVWWAGEEIGLLGSKYYVQQLSTEEKAKIALYLNYEILGAPNGARLIMGPAPDVTPPGSEKITELYSDYFNSQGLKSLVFDPIMSNAVLRSDMYPFITVGIPVGYLVSGAEMPWLPILSYIFTDLPNRIEGLSLHPCYHKACDNLTQSEGPVVSDPNFDFDLYLQMSKAAAYAIYSFAMNPDPLA